MTPVDRERALAGAAVLDPTVARLLLAELDEDDFADPTARAVLQVLGEGLCAEVDLGDEVIDDPPPGWVPPSDLEIVIEALDCSGRLQEAGGVKAVAALVQDRPELREALATARTALAAIGAVEREPLVVLAWELLG